MTNQGVFDQVYTYLARPGGTQSISDEGECLYRSKDGNRCAIGCLIPDSDYSPRMEGFCAADLSADFLPKVFSGVGVRLLQRMQYCHDQTDVDNWDSQYQWQEKCLKDMRAVAAQFKLKVPEMKGA